MARIRAANSSEVVEAKLTPITGEGISPLLTRICDIPYAVENKCPLLGVFMSRGRLLGTAIDCTARNSISARTETWTA